MTQEDEEDVDTDIDSSLFEEGDGEQEDDIEEAVARGDVEESLFVQSDEEESSDLLRSGQATESTVQFKDLTASFMNHLTENNLKTYAGTWEPRNATCPMCEDDRTVSAQDKAK
ncbi:hypothetical protein SLS57_012373, partial [Botryosphaeria dothidea]